MRNTHEEAVDYLVQRLIRKGHDYRNIKRNVLYGPPGRTFGEIDVLVTEHRSGTTHQTYYEVKTGESNPRRDARRQARTFYRFFNHRTYVTSRFVYFHAERGAEYWRKEDFHHDRKRD